MPTIPDWALALTFWIHFLAAVTLVGSLVATSVVVLPAVKTMDPLNQLDLIASIQKRMEPAAWFSLSLLIVTGLFQMSLNIHYNGFLSVSNQWTIAHFGEAHSGCNADSGQRGADLGRFSNHSPLADEKR